jgi:hypothetical protein
MPAWADVLHVAGDLRERAGYGVARRQPLRSRWQELSLIGASVAAVLSTVILAIISADGGFTGWPVRARLVSWPRVLAHVRLIPHGLALLFGRDHRQPRSARLRSGRVRDRNMVPSEQALLAKWLTMMNNSGIPYRVVLYLESNDKAFKTAPEWFAYWS